MYHFLFIKNDKNDKNLFDLFQMKILKFKIFIKLAMIIPPKLSIKGNHFKIIGKNSASTKKRFSGKIKIDVPQKSVPVPIKKSFVRKPIKILPSAKIISGITIKEEDS